MKKIRVLEKNDTDLLRNSNIEAGFNLTSRADGQIAQVDSSLNNKDL